MCIVTSRSSLDCIACNMHHLHCFMFDASCMHTMQDNHAGNNWTCSCQSPGIPPSPLSKNCRKTDTSIAPMHELPKKPSQTNKHTSLLTLQFQLTTTHMLHCAAFDITMLHKTRGVRPLQTLLQTQAIDRPCTCNDALAEPKAVPHRFTNARNGSLLADTITLQSFSSALRSRMCTRCICQHTLCRTGP